MAVTQRVGDNSWFAIAKQIDNETPIKKTSEFVANRFPFTSLGLDVESELQASDAIAGRRSDTRDQQGQLWGSGPIETQLYIEKMDEFWQAILNSDAPSTTSDPVTITGIADTAVLANTAVAECIPPNQTDPTPFTAATVPGQLEITLTATSGTLADDADLGKVSVFGQRRVGIGSEDFVPMKETDLGFTDGVANTTKYFARVDKIEFSKGIIDDTQVAIEAKPKQQRHVYKNKDDIFPGWTMQIVRGNVPAVAEGAVPVNSTLTIGDNIRLSMEILARKLHPFREIGSDAEALEITNDLKGHKFVDDVFYPNWGGLLEVDENCIIFTNLTLNINQSLDFLPGIKSSRYRLPIVPTGERRNVTLSASVYYEIGESSDMFEKWALIFQDNAPRRLTASCYYWDEIGKETYQKFSLPVSYLTASPRIGVEGRGPITRELAFKGVPASDDNPDEIEIEIVMDTPLP